MKKYFSLIGFLALVFVISAVGSYVTIPEVKKSDNVCSVKYVGHEEREACKLGWYNQLNKPSWQPPAWVFGPVWTTLYIMIAVSGWIVWRRLPEKRKFTNLIMVPYWLQLALNFLWPILFFSIHQPVWSLFDIVGMLVVIGMNIGAFMKLSKVAAYLLVPYFLWVAYATSLNAAIVAMN